MIVAAVLTIPSIILPAVPVSAAGAISVSPGNGTVGSSVSVSGNGFTPSTVNVTYTYTVSFGGSSVTSGTVTTAGSLSGSSFSVPSRPGNNYEVRVTTTAGDTAIGSFTITSNISLGSSSGFVGDTFYVAGNGFSASTGVTVFFDSVSVGSGTTDANGIFPSTLVTVPSTGRGSHSVRVSDSPSYTFTVNPKIFVTPASAAVGAQITVSGTGFSASSTASFFIDDASISGSAAVDATGGLSGTALTIPAVSGGSHTLKVLDSGGGSATVALTTSAAMTISPQNGPAGTVVTVSGKGFGTGKGITITWKGSGITTSPSPVTSDTTGSFTATFVVPAGLAGSYPVAATDGTFTGTANFDMKANATINSPKDQVGKRLTVSGEGFLAGSPVTVKYDNVQITTVNADSNGAFTVSITIPASAAGSHTITASDSINTVPVTFTVEPAASLNPTSGFVGGDVTATGSGFGVSKSINIKYDDIQVSSASTDASGGFNVTFKAPASRGGNHVVSVSDGTNTITINFAMDSTPPPLPANLIPENGASADSTAKFTWSVSPDPSGVTYDLQVATDATFSVIILEKKGLITPGYQATEAEKFKTVSSNEPYYWRVKAIDGAFNESDWTTPQTFTVGFVMPVWAIYVMVIMAMILFGLAGFWIGRKTSFRWDW